MPYAEPDATDPLALVGVEVPATRESWREMAACFAEEFARMGFDAAKLRRLFSTPGYAGAYRAREILGADEIRDVIAEALLMYGTPKSDVQDAPEEDVTRGAAPEYPPPGPCEARDPRD